MEALTTPKSLRRREVIRMAKERQSRIGGRDSKTGQFVPLRETERRPATTTREHIPLPGFGDVKSPPPKPKGK